MDTPQFLGLMEEANSQMTQLSCSLLLISASTKLKKARLRFIILIMRDHLSSMSGSRLTLTSIFNMTGWANILGLNTKATVVVIFAAQESKI